MGTAFPFFARIFRAFRYRDFRLMWMGACASTIGTFVQQFAQSWLVYDLTKDAFYLGLDLFLGQLPIIMFSLFGGVFADRLDRRKMLLFSQYIQMACAFVLAFLFVTHVVRVWHILTLSFVVGLGQSFGGPAYSALLPTLVGPEDLANAIAMNSIQFNLARILGPTIGGFTYTLLGATWCFTLNGVSYLAVIVSLFMIQVKFVPPKSRERVLTSMAEGIRFIRCRAGMSALVVLAFCTTLFGFSLTAFLPVFVKTIFHKGPETYTLLLVFSGAGSICGALIVAAMEKWKGQQRLTVLILVFLGFVTAAFSLSKWLPLILPAYLPGRRGDHGLGLAHAVAGAAHCHRRDAGTSHERVQPGLSRRDASGQSGPGKAHPHPRSLHGFRRARASCWWPFLSISCWPSETSTRPARSTTT